MATLQKIVPHLWFDDNAEEAVNFYVSLFENSRITHTAYYGEAGPGPKGTVLTVGFELSGQSFAAINGGPVFRFNEAISLLIQCDTQEEIDRFYTALLAGGTEQHCGWLKDRFGLSWQVSYSRIPAMLTDPDPQRTDRVMQAMLAMKKVDIAGLEEAFRA